MRMHARQPLFACRTRDTPATHLSAPLHQTARVFAGLRASTPGSLKKEAKRNHGESTCTRIEEIHGVSLVLVVATWALNAACCSGRSTFI